MTNTAAVIIAAVRLGRDKLKIAASRLPLLERQQASRNAIEAAVTVWAGLAGGPSLEHPSVLKLWVETVNAHGQRVAVDVAVTAIRLDGEGEET